ncbi:sialic acid-binding Ig-like lectin 15 [Rhinoraja longicauda]
MQGDNVRASMVIGRKNGTATLPCSFSPSIRNPSPITIRWMKGSSREESTVFNHSVNPPYHVPIKGGGRYELVGKLDQGEASIRVKELRLNDSSDYFCHVWVRNSTQETVTQDETKLEVVVPATILELFVESGNVTGVKTLVCRAEGKPPANITWIGPGNSTLPVNSGEMRVTHDPEKLLTVGELLHPKMPGNYTCVAVNEHQRDTRDIHLLEHGLRALAIRPAIYAVYFLMIGFTFCWLKRGNVAEDETFGAIASSAFYGYRGKWQWKGRHPTYMQFAHEGEGDAVGGFTRILETSTDTQLPSHHTVRPAGLTEMLAQKMRLVHYDPFLADLAGRRCIAVWSWAAGTHSSSRRFSRNRAPH